MRLAHAAGFPLLIEFSAKYRPQQFTVVAQVLTIQQCVFSILRVENGASRRQSLCGLVPYHYWVKIVVIM